MEISDILTIILLSFSAFLSFLALGFTFGYTLKKVWNKKQKNNSPKNIVDFKKFISNLIESLDFFSKRKIGALIIVKGEESINSQFSTNGVFLDAIFSSDLLKNIFYCKRTQLHDGAVIIEKNYRISSASVILKIGKVKAKINKSFGSKHNAAFSIVSKSNALAIVVSEITGDITTFQKNCKEEKIKKSNKNNYKNLIEKIEKWKNET